MPDPVELSDSLYDSSIETVGTVSPGATPYKIRVSAALQSTIAGHTAELDDHEDRIVVLEAGGGGGGSGDVVGPGSATDNAVVRFNLTTGKLVQNSVVTIADSTGDMAGVGTLNTRTIASFVDGPASVTDGRVVAFDGTGGKLIKQDTRLAADLVAGPASSTDNAVVRFDSTTGKLVQNSACIVADTTGSIDNTGGSGTVTSTRFIGPATALRSATTSIDVVAATAPSTGQVLTATDSTHATWQSPSAGVTIAEFWVPPTVAGSGPGGAVDEELVSGGIPAFFTPLTTAGASLTRDGDVDISQTPASAHYRSRVGHRGKGLLYQAPPAQSHMLAHQFSGTALNTAFTFRIRMGCASGYAGAAAGSCLVQFCPDVAGVPDQTNNYVRFGFSGNGSNDQVILTAVQFSGGGGSPVSSGNVWPNVPDGEWVLRHSYGGGGSVTTIHFVPPHGVGQQMLRLSGVTAFNTTDPWVIIRMGNQGTVDPALYRIWYWRWENLFASVP